MFALGKNVNVDNSQYVFVQVLCNNLSIVVFRIFVSHITCFLALLEELYINLQAANGGKTLLLRHGEGRYMAQRHYASI